MLRSRPHHIAPYWLVAALTLMAAGCAPESSTLIASDSRYTFTDQVPEPTAPAGRNDSPQRMDAPAAPPSRCWLWFTLPQGCVPCVALDRRIRPTLEKLLTIRSIEAAGPGVTANVWVVSGTKHPLVACYGITGWPRLLLLENDREVESHGADIDPAHILRTLGYQNAAASTATLDFVAPEGQLTFVPMSPPVVFAHNGNELRFSRIDAKITSSGSTVKVKFAEPRPIVSGRVWGFRVSDTLDETTITPTGAEMLTWRWKSKRVINW